MELGVTKETLKKIQDIRELAERAGTPDEAAAAAGKLAALLVKNGLTMMDLDLHATASGRKVVEANVLLYSYRYLHVLYGHVARAHQCKAVVMPQHRKNYSYMSLIGHDHNIVVVQDVAKWLTGLCDSMCNKTWRGMPNVERLKYPESSWKRAFKLGFVDAIGRAYDGATEELRKEEVWALVPMLEAEVQAAVDEIHGKLRQLPATKPVLSDGYQKGKKAGEGVNLKDKQVGGSEAPVAIG